MNIEFWWPYKGQDDDGIESNGRFRKARVLKTTKPKPKSTKSGLETCLREDLGVSSAVFMKSDWENTVHRVSKILNIHFLNLFENILDLRSFFEFFSHFCESLEWNLP